MKVSICVGSSCHLKGSKDIIACFKDLVAKNRLENEVELKAAFCLGHCMDGVTIQVDDEIVTGVNPQNAEAVFQERILGGLKE